jgi:hypothetical protein
MNEPPQRRHSVPANADLITDPQQQAEAESLNALRQFDQGVTLIRTYTSDDGRPFKFRPKRASTGPSARNHDSPKFYERLLT